MINVLITLWKYYTRPERRIVTEQWEKDIVKGMAKRMSEEIDKEIMKTLLADAEQENRTE